MLYQLGGFAHCGFLPSITSETCTGSIVTTEALFSGTWLAGRYYLSGSMKTLLHSNVQFKTKACAIVSLNCCAPACLTNDMIQQWCCKGQSKVFKPYTSQYLTLHLPRSCCMLYLCAAHCVAGRTASTACRQQQSLLHQDTQAI